MQSCCRRYSILVLNIAQLQLRKNLEKLGVSRIRTRPELGPLTLIPYQLATSTSHAFATKSMMVQCSIWTSAMKPLSLPLGHQVMGLTTSY